MFLILLALILTGQQAGGARVEHFREIPAANVPREVFAIGAWCDFYKPLECRREFLKRGHAWMGDVNGDGVRELVVQGVVLGGTGGDPYWIFREGKESWAPLTAQAGWLTTTHSPRFDILPIVRSGYHDIRAGVVDCFKWDGTMYVRYDAADFRSLSPSWFDRKFEEAELFWAIRYRGLKTSTFEPQWLPGAPLWSSNVELDDPMLGVRWVATFKGGFLLPRSIA